jgi:hypothetical protein
MCGFAAAEHAEATNRAIKWAPGQGKTFKQSFLLSHQLCRTVRTFSTSSTSSPELRMAMASWPGIPSLLSIPQTIQNLILLFHSKKSE